MDVYKFLPRDQLALAFQEAGLLQSIVNTTGSTNDDIKAFCREHPISGPRIHFAYDQTAGRGTRGRRWHNFQGGALTFTLALPMAVAGNTVPTLAVGAGIVRAMRTLGLDIALKWPNDLWADGKLGGVLCESCSDSSGQRVLIVGIGINLFDAGQRTDRGWPVRGILNVKTVDGIALMRAVVEKVVEALKMPLDDVLRCWTDFDAFYGKKVIFQDQGRCYDGYAQGVDDQGRFKLQAADAEYRFYSGSIVNVIL